MEFLVKYLLIFILLASTATLSTVPAKPIELTKAVLKEQGFRVEIEKMRGWVTITLHAPAKIEQHWEIVATQSYPFKSENPEFLSKIGVEGKKSDTEVFVSYFSEKSDASVGVYYTCTDESGESCVYNRERLYSIYSLNEFTK